MAGVQQPSVARAAGSVSTRRFDQTCGFPARESNRGAAVATSIGTVSCALDLKKYAGNLPV